MAKVIYVVVEHDGGWAYRVGEVFSETFPRHGIGRCPFCRDRAAAPGETTGISWEDKQGRWHDQFSKGDDRPVTDVEG